RPHAVSPCISGSSSRPPTRSPTATGSGRSIALDRRRSSARTTTTARAISPIRAARSSRRRARRTSSFSSPTWTWIWYARSATRGSSIATAVPTCTTTWSSRSATSREASVSRLVYAPHGPDGLARPWSDYRDRRVRARPVTSRRPRHRRGAGRLAGAPAAHVRPDSDPSEPRTVADSPARSQAASEDQALGESVLRGADHLAQRLAAPVLRRAARCESLEVPVVAERTAQYRWANPR